MSLINVTNLTFAYDGSYENIFHYYKRKERKKSILKIEEDMKKSRLFSLMMVAVLVFSLCSNAFAADETVR